MALAAVHVASWVETYRGIMPDAMIAAHSVESRAAMWHDVLADSEAFGGAQVFVAEEAGRPIGFGACGRQRDPALAEAGYHGEIVGLYVLRSQQNRGTGRALMAAMADAMPRKGPAGASLWVLRDNMRARAFYERMGGVIVGQKKDRRFDSALLEMAYGWGDCSLLTK